MPDNMNLMNINQSPVAGGDTAPALESFVRRALLLSWFTIIFNIAEGLVSIYFGLSEESVALAGFGLDSFIEVGSAFLVLWRFRSETVDVGTGLGLERERKATYGIGILFVLLSIATAFGAVYKLVRMEPPDTALPGFIISSISLGFMYFLYASKRNVAVRLDSATVMKDAACSLACIKLSAVLFAGSLVYILFPILWWADSVAAASLAVLIGNEGWETIKSARSPDFSGGCGCVDQASRTTGKNLVN
jgi:divalent metal cation (Fe/Co/Zn/Cd) transporter